MIICNTLTDLVSPMSGRPLRTMMISALGTPDSTAQKALKFSNSKSSLTSKLKMASVRVVTVILIVEVEGPFGLGGLGLGYRLSLLLLNTLSFFPTKTQILKQLQYKLKLILNVGTRDDKAIAIEDDGAYPRNVGKYALCKQIISLHPSNHQIQAYHFPCQFTTLFQSQITNTIISQAFQVYNLHFGRPKVRNQKGRLCRDQYVQFLCFGYRIL